MSAATDFNLLRPGAVDAPYELLSRYTHINRGGVNILYIMQDLLYTVQNIIAGMASVSQDPGADARCESKFKIDVGQGRPRVTLQYEESDDDAADDAAETTDDSSDETEQTAKQSQSNLVTSSVPPVSHDNSMDTWSSVVASEVRSDNLQSSSPVEEIEVVPDVAMMCKDISFKTEESDRELNVMQCGSKEVNGTEKRNSNQVSIIRVNTSKPKEEETTRKVINVGEDQLYFNSTSSITISRIKQESEQYRHETVINSNNRFVETPFADKCTIRNITHNVEYKQSYHVSNNVYDDEDDGNGPNVWPQYDEFSRNVTSMNFEVSQRLPNKMTYPCRHCGKQFRFLSQKDIHERVHTGEKPFTCKICKKHFSQIGTKRRHERTHTMNAITMLPVNIT